MTTLTVSGNIEVFEYSPTVGVTATANTNVGNVTITSVVRGAYATGTNISFSGNVVSITGRYAEVFPKTVTYLDVNRAVNTVNSFTDLPSEYFLISGYAASSVRTVDAEYIVYADIGDEFYSNSNVYIGTITQTVLNNYTPGRDALQVAVPKGQF